MKGELIYSGVRVSRWEQISTEVHSTDYQGISKMNKRGIEPSSEEIFKVKIFWRVPGGDDEGDPPPFVGPVVMWKFSPQPAAAGMPS